MNPCSYAVKREPEEMNPPCSYTVKREPEELGSTIAQPVTKKVKKETRRHVKEESFKQQHNLQEPDTKNVKLEIIHNSIASNLLEEDLHGNAIIMPHDVKRHVENSIRRLPDKGQMAVQITSRWNDLTEKETFRQEICQWMNPNPPQAHLDMFWNNLSNDLKGCIAKQSKVRKTFYRYTRRAVDKQLGGLNGWPDENALHPFAIYFRETQKGVKARFPAMTRQEVYDTCLLRYFATSKREKKKYEHERRMENMKIYMHRRSMFRKENVYSPNVNHLSEEEIEAYIKQKEGGILKLGESEGRQLINVVDIKECSMDMLANQINCRWKDLTAEKHFQYEVAGAFGGVIPVEDIDAAWRNLRMDMRVRYLLQIGIKVNFFALTKGNMERELNEGVLYSFSSYFCEMENVIKTEFPDMTEAEVYETCLLRYVAAPKSIRHVYEILSTIEECRKLYKSRFGIVYESG